MPARRKPRDPSLAIGYIRVSTDEQGVSGLGVEAQRGAIVGATAVRGLNLVEVYADLGVSGKDLRRPELSRALDALDSGAVSVLIVSKLDRLSRSVYDASGLMKRAAAKGWGFVALDLGVDTTTPQGKAMAHMAATFAELERDLISQRTRDALAVKRANGVRLGRPTELPEAVGRRIVRARRRGGGWSAIAARLNAGGVPTAHGGRRWYPATVRAVFLSRTEVA